MVIERGGDKMAARAESSTDGQRRVVILGATGSIGDSAQKVARDIPERMEIVGLAANSSAAKLAAQANELRPEAVCIVDPSKLDELRSGIERCVESMPAHWDY